MSALECVIEPLICESDDFDTVASAVSAYSSFTFLKSISDGIKTGNKNLNQQFSYHGLELQRLSLDQTRSLKIHNLPIKVSSAASYVPFKGGILTYLPYESSQSKSDSAQHPQYFWLARELMIVDHIGRRIFISFIRGKDIDVSPRISFWLQKFSGGETCLGDPSIEKTNESREWVADATTEEHAACVANIQNHIAQGEISQAILSIGFSRPTNARDYEIFQCFKRRNASPQIFLVRLEDEDMSVVGASPAMHLSQLGGEVLVEIDAGTRRVGSTDRETEDLKRQLLSSKKDIEEQKMLVEETKIALENISDTIVRTSVDLEVRRLGNVMHLFTVLETRVRDSISPVDVVLSCFPSAAVTGAPRKSAMAVIKSVEKINRGPYGGIIGLLGCEGSTDTAIVLRSVWLNDGLASIRCGGGITHASVATEEFSECLNKASFILGCVDAAEESRTT